MKLKANFNKIKEVPVFCEKNTFVLWSTCRNEGNSKEDTLKEITVELDGPHFPFTLTFCVCKYINF